MSVKTVILVERKQTPVKTRRLIWAEIPIVLQTSVAIPKPDPAPTFHPTANQIPQDV
jgi:hypothetical protein